MTTNIEAKRTWARIKRERAVEALPSEKAVFSAYSVIGAVILATILILCAGLAQAGEIPEDDAVRILIGEAANQGKVGMIAVAEVLRKRGSTKGFCGLKGKHVDSQPAWVWEMARKAWRASEKTNYTRGATHFENLEDFGTPYWAENMEVVFVHKDHTFYRERRG